MSPDNDIPDKSLKALRKKAEAKLESDSASPTPSPEEARIILHELQTHQIELELQNEDLRKAQVELLKSREKYTDLYDFSPVGYITVSDTGMILEANLTAASMIGTDKTSLNNQPLSIFISSDSQDQYYLCRKRLLETKQPQTCEIRIQRKDGDQFDAQCKCVVNLDLDGDSGQFRTTITDISALKRAEEIARQYSENLESMVEARTEELKKAQKQLLQQEKLAAIGKLSASVAHDIRNPLGVIQNSIYYLKLISNEGTSEKIREHFSLMESEINRVSRTIGDLLDFSRDSAPNFLKGNITRFIENHIKDFQKPDNIKFETGFDPAIPDLPFDYDAMHRVMYNLIINAVQAMPEGGKIHISTRVSGPNIEIEVRDEGTGITKENIPVIFGALFTTKSKGVGLGLSIVETLTEKHGGKVKVRSKVGKGTAFTVQLPINQEKPS